MKPKCITAEMRKHREKPNEGEEQDNPTLWELAKEHNVSFADAIPIQENLRLKKEAKIEAAKIKKDVSEMDKLKKRAQEAEGELSIMKGIETNRVKEAQARCNQLQNELDRVKLENNNLYTRVSDAMEVNEYHQDLNGKLRKEVEELHADLARAKEDHQFDNLVHQKELESMRKK